MKLQTAPRPCHQLVPWTRRPRLNVTASCIKHKASAVGANNPALTLALAASVSLSAFFSDINTVSAAAQTFAVSHHAVAYEQQISSRRPKSNLPSSDEAAALQLLADRDLFTDEAWAGMVKLQQYAKYVESVATKGAEEAPSCEACTANRMMLEKAWQTIANEFYDPSGHFSQAAWAEQLLTVLKSHNGVLHSKQDTYLALHQLVGSLRDK
eukprot:GHRR01008516.1.p1 GENE.GHRR01008516.1~~GHRR01008516.1.p1  ORF type:complete len:211 (+),score=57.85 GHRR01008516.1:167-799(+)